MGLFREHRRDRAHVRIIENTHIALAFLEQMSQSMNSPQAIPARKMFAETLNVLSRAYEGQPICYQDYEPMVTAARKIGSMAWNPGSEGVSNLVAAITATLDETGWQLDNEPELFSHRQIEIPDLAKRLHAERVKLGQVNEVELSPYARLVRESDLRSIGEAMNAADNLYSSAGKTLAADERALAKLNVEFVSEPVLSAWLHSIAAKKLLPNDPAAIFRALDDVEAHFHASATTKEKLVDQWVADHPNLDREWVGANVSALLCSACSTKLDTLHYSSVDIVRDLVASTYQKHNAPQKLNEDLDQTAPLKELQSVLDTIGTQLHRLEGRLPDGMTQTALQEVKVLSERLTEKTGNAIRQMEGDSGESPDGSPIRP